MNIDDKIFNALWAVDKGVHYCFDHLHDTEMALLEAFEFLFSPSLILRQVGMIAALQLFVGGYQLGERALLWIYQRVTTRGRLERSIEEALGQATSYTNWLSIAAQLDSSRGDDVWRKIDDCPLYDMKTLKKLIKGTNEMLQRGDIFDLMFRLRGGLARDQYGLQHEGLFSRARAGSKFLVERYHDTIATALNYICDSPLSDEMVPLDAKLSFFNETRHAYGRTALLLSGGAYLGFYHIGVMKSLWSVGLLPRVMSGASAGSLMCATVGTRTDSELVDLFDHTDENVVPNGISLEFFRYSNELQNETARKLNYLVPVSLRWITHPLLALIFDKKLLSMDTEHFKTVVLRNTGTYTFQEAFDRTGRIINITVAPLNNFDPPRLLNYLTAPHVCVWSAAVASCALPGVFDPSCLIVKDPDGRFVRENEWTRQSGENTKEFDKSGGYSDGSVENDLPMQQLSELFNVNHFIVSQVNPHSAILMSMSSVATIWSSRLFGIAIGVMRFLKCQVRDWIKNIVSFAIFRSAAPEWSSKRGMSQTLTQEYEGRDKDVTIMPWVDHISAPRALCYAIRNPDLAEFYEVIEAACRKTWPAIPRIRAHCLVEHTLDQCVQRMRKKIAVQQQEAMAKEAQENKRGNSSEFGEVPNKRMDRVPSFYSSRTLLANSGLSVSDPMPEISSRPDRRLDRTPSTYMGKSEMRGFLLQNELLPHTNKEDGDKRSPKNALELVTAEEYGRQQGASSRAPKQRSLKHSKDDSSSSSISSGLAYIGDDERTPPVGARPFRKNLSSSISDDKYLLPGQRTKASSTNRLVDDDLAEELNAIAVTNVTPASSLERNRTQPEDSTAKVGDDGSTFDLSIHGPNNLDPHEEFYNTRVFNNNAVPAPSIPLKTSESFFTSDDTLSSDEVLRSEMGNGTGRKTISFMSCSDKEEGNTSADGFIQDELDRRNHSLNATVTSATGTALVTASTTSSEPNLGLTAFELSHMSAAATAEAASNLGKSQSPRPSLHGDRTDDHQAIAE